VWLWLSGDNNIFLIVFSALMVSYRFVRLISLVKFISKYVKVLIVVALIVAVSLYLVIYALSLDAGAGGDSSSANGGLSSSLVSASVLSSNDTNWAGYIVVSDVQNPQANVTGVSASWTVPTVTISSEDTLSAVWIGIGGLFDSTLIQTGTEQDSIQGQSEYSAWVELLPQNAITIDTMTISPGDQMNASIQLVDANFDQWSITIQDLTTTQDYTGSFFYTSSQLSAEWIVERPEISSTRSRGTLTNLTDVGAVTFTDCQATISSETGPISSFPTVQSIMYQTVEQTTGTGLTQLAAVSDLTDNGSSFTVETSPTAIPEISALILVPSILGISLIAAITKKRARLFQK
jgi:hypothetical protein